jgi:hypothetical protein
VARFGAEPSVAGQIGFAAYAFLFGSCLFSKLTDQKFSPRGVRFVRPQE